MSSACASSAGSATSGADIILARSNSGGYCGFNSAGQSFNASDRTVKENFEPVSNAEILEKLVAMPITKWNFKQQDESVKYVGPMAQDFHAAFGLGGTNDRVIHATNAQGITMAALQGLNTKVEDKSKALDAAEAAKVTAPDLAAILTHAVKQGVKEALAESSRTHLQRDEKNTSNVAQLG